MKTKKVKGFTLIELIVVIAIIGVLAAILVPSMLGYVKKSKIQAANTAASSVYKALNSALTELDEEDYDVTTLDGTYTKAKNGEGADITKTADAADTVEISQVYEYALPYFEDFVKTDCAFYIETGTCKAVGVKAGSYCGSYPKCYTAKNYDDMGEGYSAKKDRDAADALADTMKKNGITEAKDGE